jgi:hypothetical protein
MAGSKDPKWLEPLWERKKSETAKRVEGAVKELVNQGQTVTLDGIRHTVRALFGVSISANTVRRNEGAYAAYQKHRTELPPVKAVSRSFAVMLRAVPGAGAVNLRAKINRLRRERKDSLIARLLQLEAERKRQSDREDTLREEILRLHQSTWCKGVGQ